MHTLILLFALLLVCSTSVVSSQDDGRISITVPAAPWTLTLHRTDTAVKDQKVKPDGRSGYFLLADSSNRITVSLFIEPAIKCKSSKECRNMVWKAGNPSWENPQNVVLGEIGEVSFFEFFMPTFRQMPVREQHMYAQFVVDEFWVDMHISKTLYQPDEHKLFEDVIKSVKFEPKKAKVIRPGSSPDEAAEAWMLLWDAGNYDESYKELAEKTKKEFTQRDWYALWYRVRRPLGMVKTRKLTERMKTPSGTGAILKYETSFQFKTDTHETLVLTSEQDGTWRVVLYLLNGPPLPSKSPVNRIK